MLQLQKLQAPLEVRGVQSHGHEQSGDQTSTWKGNDPGREDESNLLPVDSANIEVAKGDTDSCSGQALCCGDRKTEATGQENSDSSPKFHGEATSRRNLSDLVSEGAHDVEAVN
jgi:hypothetical protein